MKRYLSQLVAVVVAAIPMVLSNAEADPISIRDYSGTEIPDESYNDGDLGGYIGEGTLWVDLAEATTGRWSDPSPQPGKGIYDPNKWAVVFKYSSVNISTFWGAAIAFHNHPSRAPVVWLVSGDVTIGTKCTVDLNGANGMGTVGFAEGGPGGFRGARGSLPGTLGSAGFGPGGGNVVFGSGFAAASYGGLGSVFGDIAAQPTYGNIFIIPLIGGSGGAADSRGYDYASGSAGGGAILIVAKGKITVEGAITANGGLQGNAGSGGSGGAIRLVADTIQGAGLLRATQGVGTWIEAAGGMGRISVQANTITLGDAGVPPYKTFAGVTGPVHVFPPPDQERRIRPTKLVLSSGAEVPIPADPKASLDIPLTDVSFDTADPAVLHIQATNVPLNWLVVARIVPKTGNSFSVTADPLQGTLELSTTTAQLALPNGISAIQVRASRP